MRDAAPPIWYLGAVLTVLAASGWMLHDTTSGPRIGLLSLMIVAAFLVWRTAASSRSIATILAVAFSLRLLAAVLDHTFGLFPKEDQNGYLNEATWLAEAWHLGTTTNIEWTTNVGAYVHFLAPFFWLFGPHAMIPRVLSALLGLAATYLVYRLTKDVLGERPAIAAAMVYAVYPTFVYIQSETLRDPIIHVLVLGALALSIKGMPRSWNHGAVLVAVLAVLALFRLASLLPLVATICVLIVQGFVARRANSPRHLSSPGTTGPLRPLHLPLHTKVMMGGIIALVVAWLGSVYTQMLMKGGLTNYRSHWATGGSSYLEGVAFANIFEVILFAPLAAFYFLFTPFPWHVHNDLAFIAALQNLLVAYPIAVLAFIGLRRHQEHRRLVTLLMFLGFGALLFGLVEGNVGTALRHRTQFIWVFIVLASPVLVSIWDRLRVGTVTRSAGRSVAKEKAAPTR